MDTAQVLNYLTVQKADSDKKSQAFDIAIGIIRGTLATQSSDLETKYRNQMAALSGQTDALAAANAILEAEKAALAQNVESLELAIEAAGKDAHLEDAAAEITNNEQTI